MQKYDGLCPPQRQQNRMVGVVLDCNSCERKHTDLPVLYALQHSSTCCLCINKYSCSLFRFSCCRTRTSVSQSLSLVSGMLEVPALLLACPAVGYFVGCVKASGSDVSWTSTTSSSGSKPCSAARANSKMSCAWSRKPSPRRTASSSASHSMRSNKALASASFQVCFAIKETVLNAQKEN